MARRNRRKEASADKVRGIILGLVGIALIGILLVMAYLVRSTRVERDASTYCPKSGPTSVHIVLVDQSDPISPQKAQRVRQVIDQISVRSPVGTRFDFYSVVGDPFNELAPEFRICVPPRQANEWVQNPDRIRAQYEQGYSKAVDNILAKLLVASTRSTSPIIESIRAAAQTSFGSVAAGETALRITLVSDMVQHSNAVSHLRTEPDFGQLSRRGDWASLRPRLNGATVDILYILRTTAVRGNRQVQNRGHQAFWEQLIIEGGGQLASIEPF